MNNVFKKLVIISLGGLVGGVIGYFAGGLIVYKLESQAFEKLLEEVTSEEEEEEKDSTDDVPTNKVKHRQISYNKIATNEQEGNPVSELEALASQYKSSIEEKAPAHKEPYVVNEEFASERSNFENVTLVYYDKDDTLCDLGEGVIDNVTKLLGGDALTHFGPPSSEDPDTVYICNPKEGKVFEIQRVHKSYSEDVLGLKERKPSPKKGKVRNGHKPEEHESDDEE